MPSPIVVPIRTRKSKTLRRAPGSAAKGIGRIIDRIVPLGTEEKGPTVLVQRRAASRECRSRPVSAFRSTFAANGTVSSASANEPSPALKVSGTCPGRNHGRNIIRSKWKRNT